MDCAGAAMKIKYLKIVLCAMLLTGLLGSCALKDEAKIDALAAKVVGALPEEWPEEEMISQFVERARPNPDQLAEIQILRVGLGHIPEINTATDRKSVV